MANTTLTQTGAQVQDILDKADKLPSSLGTAGQVLTMNAGATAPVWQTPSAGGGNGHTLNLLNIGGGWCTIYYADGTSVEGNTPTDEYSNVIAIGAVGGYALTFTSGLMINNASLLLDGVTHNGCYILLTDCSVTCESGN